ncbi:hypothetical protein EVAR_20564_1 [Eumeta japonica]|uniref:Uncharacterized protein n=1 Tax=Eumeta variegata TaxID=151549 RepID=A0A4C1UT84_EUMVA|nr:hypothetical protein EVAR_20564_1 [Eumeta japonica]
MSARSDTVIGGIYPPFWEIGTTNTPSAFPWASRKRTKVRESVKWPAPIAARANALRNARGFVRGPLVRESVSKFQLLRFQFKTSSFRSLENNI